MGKDPLGDVAIPIKCPKCGKELLEKIARLKGDPKITCSGCGVVISVDGKQLREATKPFDDLNKLFE